MPCSLTAELLSLRWGAEGGADGLLAWSVYDVTQGLAFPAPSSHFGSSGVQGCIHILEHSVRGVSDLLPPWLLASKTNANLT